MGQLRPAGRRPSGGGGAGSRGADAAARGLRGGGGEGRGLSSLSPPSDLPADRVSRYLALPGGSPCQGNTKRNGAIRRAYELRRRPRGRVCRPGGVARPAGSASGSLAEGNAAKAGGLRTRG